MPSILICGAASLRDELRSTAVFRQNHVHYYATTVDEALRVARTMHPDLVVADRDVPGALRLVEELRREASTRSSSIVVAAHGDISEMELQLVEGGANTVIRLPAGPEWDERLAALMHVPGRRAARLPVRLELSGSSTGPTRCWGAALNVSETGMLVELDCPLVIGEDAELRFRLSHSEQPIECTARVVREDLSGRYGVRFERLEREGLLRLRRYVAEGSATARRFAAEPATENPEA